MINSDSIITEPTETTQSGLLTTLRSFLPRSRWWLSIVSGLLLWLAHPQPGLWLLAWVGLAPFVLITLRAKGFWQATWRGYLFGWFYLGPVCYWTGLTIVGWTGSQFGWLALFLLTMITALFYACWSGFAWLLGKHTTGYVRIVAIAALWVLVEWLRSVGAYSFPWAQLAYTQYLVTPLIQLSEATGALGVSFLIVCCNATLAEWWLRRGEEQSRRWIWGMVTLLTLTALSGMARMVYLTDGKPLMIGVMQGNFNYKNGKDPVEEKVRVFNALTEAATLTTPAPIDLFAWAESASPGDAINERLPSQLLQRLATDYSAGILTGSYTKDPDGKIYNTAVLFQSDATSLARHDKQGIVPFGEFIPFRNLIPASVQNSFQFFPDDLTPGKELKPLNLKTRSSGEVPIGVCICYESVYPHYARTLAMKGATVLVFPSHDRWFQSDSALEQHLSISVFRAVENRRDIARPTTDGISAFIDARGRILSRAPVQTPCFLIHDVHQGTIISFYTRYGDWFVGCCVLLILLALTRKQWEAQLEKIRLTRTNKPKGA